MFILINYLLTSARSHKFGRQGQTNVDEDDDGDDDDDGGGRYSGGYNGYAEGTGDMAGKHVFGYTSIKDMILSGLTNSVIIQCKRRIEDSGFCGGSVLMCILFLGNGIM
jgi:hypothetical protein